MPSSNGCMTFLFRWLNCLLMREVPLNLAIRLLDTCLGEGHEGLAGLLPYLCLAFLQCWREELLSMDDYLEMLALLQRHPGTDAWVEADIDVLLSWAYLLKEHSIRDLHFNGPAQAKSHSTIPSKQYMKHRQ